MVYSHIRACSVNPLPKAIYLCGIEVYWSGSGCTLTYRGLNLPQYLPIHLYSE
jgi:hypothetical protein